MCFIESIVLPIIRIAVWVFVLVPVGWIIAGEVVCKVCAKEVFGPIDIIVVGLTIGVDVGKMSFLAESFSLAFRLLAELTLAACFGTFTFRTAFRACLTFAEVDSRMLDLKSLSNLVEIAGVLNA